MSHLHQETIEAFYRKVLEAELRAGRLAQDTSILVVCGGGTDYNVLSALGFRNVTISNLDPRITADAYAPFAWASQNAENLTFADDQFDVTIVHSGLHHCYSPQRAIVEMLRVSRRGIIGFEPVDSLITRIGSLLGLGQAYENSSVFGHDCKYGGVANSPIPNFVYRFSEHELRKCACCALPIGHPDLHFYYALRINRARLRSTRNPIAHAVLSIVLKSAEALNKVTKLLSNNIAFAIYKPSDDALHPWIKRQDKNYVVDAEWMNRRFKKINP